MRHGNYGFRQENRNVPVSLTCFSFVMKYKESKVDESVDSLTDIGDFGIYCKDDFERIFSCSRYVGYKLVRENGRLRYRQ